MRKHSFIHIISGQVMSADSLRRVFDFFHESADDQQDQDGWKDTTLLRKRRDIELNKKKNN